MEPLLRSLRKALGFGIGAFVCVTATVTIAAAAGHDAREMTHGEQLQFLQLVCRHATYDTTSKERNCGALLGYPGGATAVRGFSLTAVAYGNFTKPHAQQAYVSYFTMFEPHANNFGGGILFERSDGPWKLVRWYPGGQMDECVAVPGTGIARMLCRIGYMQEGLIDTTVVVRTVPVSNRRGAMAAGSEALINVEDNRGMSMFLGPSASEAKCGTLAAYRPGVVLVESLKRSHAPGYFAESEATYLTAREQLTACRTHTWDKMKGAKTTIRYALRGGKVVFDSPLPIREREN